MWSSFCLSPSLLGFVITQESEENSVNKLSTWINKIRFFPRYFAPEPPKEIDDLIGQPWSPEASKEVDKWIVKSESTLSGSHDPD